MTRKIGAAAAAAALFASGASAMSVADFLGRVDALKAKGAMALFAWTDIRALQDEGKAATIAWWAQVDPPGARRNACPPAGFKAPGRSEFLEMLQAVPPAHRADTSVSDATIHALNRRFPCRG